MSVLITIKIEIICPPGFNGGLPLKQLPHHLFSLFFYDLLIFWIVLWISKIFYSASPLFDSELSTLFSIKTDQLATAPEFKFFSTKSLTTEISQPFFCNIAPTKIPHPNANKPSNNLRKRNKNCIMLWGKIVKIFIIFSSTDDQIF